MLFKYSQSNNSHSRIFFDAATEQKGYIRLAEETIVIISWMRVEFSQSAGFSHYKFIAYIC